MAMGGEDLDDGGWLMYENIDAKQIIAWCKTIRNNGRLLNSIDNRTLDLSSAYRIAGAIIERISGTPIQDGEQS